MTLVSLTGHGRGVVCCVCVSVCVHVCTSVPRYVCTYVCVYVCIRVGTHACIVASEGLDGCMYWCLFQVSGLQVDRRIAGPYQGWNSRTK